MNANNFAELANLGLDCKSKFATPTPKEVEDELPGFSQKDCTRQNGSYCLVVSHPQMPEMECRLTVCWDEKTVAMFNTLTSTALHQGICHNTYSSRRDGPIEILDVMESVSKTETLREAVDILKSSRFFSGNPEIVSLTNENAKITRPLKAKEEFLDKCLVPIDTEKFVKFCRKIDYSLFQLSEYSLKCEDELLVIGDGDLKMKLSCGYPNQMMNLASYIINGDTHALGKVVWLVLNGNTYSLEHVIKSYGSPDGDNKLYLVDAETEAKKAIIKEDDLVPALSQLMRGMLRALEDYSEYE